LRRFALLSVVSIALSVGVSGVAGSAESVPSQWAIRDLGASSWGVAINDRGQIVGEDFFWANGKSTNLGTLGGWRVTATAVNGRGQVIGSSVTGKDAPIPLKPHAFLWQNARMVDLTPAAHPDAKAVAINDRCQIVGYQADPVKAAYVWQGGKLTVLGRLPGATDSTANAINDRGQIVGWSGAHAVLWQEGSVTDLGTLPGDRFSRAEAINGKGWIVGWSSATWNGKAHGVLWSGAKTIDLGAGRAWAINERGQIIGDAYLWENGHRTDLGLSPTAINGRGTIVGQDFRRDAAVVWQDGHITALPGLGGRDRMALDINDHDQIVGWATTRTGEQHAVLWTRHR
jgi:probable HAF family extracellular repeat protein